MNTEQVKSLREDTEYWKGLAASTEQELAVAVAHRKKLESDAELRIMQAEDKAAQRQALLMPEAANQQEQPALHARDIPETSYKQARSAVVAEGDRLAQIERDAANPPPTPPTKHAALMTPGEYRSALSVFKGSMPIPEGTIDARELEGSDYESAKLVMLAAANSVAT